MVLTPTIARAASLSDGDTWGSWRVVFAGYGSVTATGSGNSSRLTLSPAVAATPAETHAALVVSQNAHQDVRLRARVGLDAQLRENSSANPWESGWLVTRYQDPEHFYYLALKTNGWELGKRDPTYPGGATIPRHRQHTPRRGRFRADRSPSGGRPETDGQDQRHHRRELHRQREALQIRRRRPLLRGRGRDLQSHLGHRTLIRHLAHDACQTDGHAG